MSRFWQLAKEEESKRNQDVVWRSAHRHGIAAISVLVILATVTTSAQNPDPLKVGFENPPQSARPRVWWHWMSGNVSQQGAELDLEWMNRVGIGGVHTFSGS